MRFPGILPLAFFLFAVPALVPVIERFWPTATVWWSAVLVALLGAAASALWIVYRSQLAKSGMPAPSAAPEPVDGDDYTHDWMVRTGQLPKPQQTPFKRWLLG